MGKRTVLAIVLSATVLFGYSLLVSKMYPTENKENVAKSVDILSSVSVPSSKLTSMPTESLSPVLEPQEYVEFENDKFKIIFANPGAYIHKIILKEYSEEFFLEDLFIVPEELNSKFKVRQLPGVITFTFKGNGREIIRRFSISNDSYSIVLERSERGLSGDVSNPARQILLASKVVERSAYENRFMELAINTPKKTIRKKLLSLRDGTLFSQMSDWVGVRDRYFTFLVRPSAAAQNVFIGKDASGVKIGLTVGDAPVTSLSSSQQVDVFTIYCGPQDLDELSKLNVGFENIVHFGFFDPISQVLLAVLKFFFRFTHNWGVAILLFGIFISLILYPLSLKQIRSMKEMQILQPKVKELQERYKENPQQLNKATMELYKEHRVNPLGGCLPMILQIPVFFALYQALMRFIGLRGATFLWIKDLSQPDRLIPFSQEYPIIGDGFNLLPILMMGSMFMQQKFSAAAMSGGGSSDQQRMMMFMMPLLFGFIFYRMPSGLVLYWLIYGTLSGLNQWFNTRKKTS
ncbi:MAG TPA: membrane protein insertase YidC [Candidatus Omnitrophica bacterium]|nr:membrane protein insertase YidC [Candidatus Omnitrophota bacterium]